MYSHVFFFCDICESLHEQFCHLIDRGRFLKLIAKQQSFDLTFESISDLLISLLCSIVLNLFIATFLLHLQWHMDDRRRIVVILRGLRLLVKRGRIDAIDLF